MYDLSGENCITKSQDFSLVQEPVLKATLTAIHRLKGDLQEQCKAGLTLNDLYDKLV